MINNPFEENGIKFNYILNFTNTSLYGKNVPIVSVDLNNVPMEALTEEQIKYILTSCSKYNQDYVSKLLSTDEK